MNKQEFLHHAFKNQRYLEVNWWVRCLSSFVESANVKLPTDPYYLVRQPWGLGVTMPDGTIDKLSDYTGDAAAFTPKFKVKVDNSWLSNIDTPMETTLGILMANALLIDRPLRGKIKYINGEVTIGKLESIITKVLTDDPKPGEPWAMTPDVIYTTEYRDINKGIEVICAVMDLFTIALTRKTLLPPPGIADFKKKVLEEDKPNLDDPIQLAAFEKRLLSYDAEYLKDDPSFGKFATGKILKDSRKKLYLSMGAEGGFSKDGSIVGVAQSLSETDGGDPRIQVASVNGARQGSYSRGAETMEGGVAAKKMLAASNNYIMVPGDCGSKMGLIRKYTPWLVNSLKGRTIIDGASQIKLDRDADVSPYLGKFVRTRSPMYCRLPGEQICVVCAGDSMGRFGAGVALPLTEISASVLAARMKAMHTNALTVVHFDIKELFS